MEWTLEKSMDFLAGLKMTVASGVFLAASLILLLTGTELLIDPVRLGLRC